MAIDIKTDTSQLDQFIQKIEEVAPEQLTIYLTAALKKIGSSDLRKFKKEQLSGGSGLTLKSNGVKKSFKSKVFGKKLSELELVEYTGWKAAEIFQTGGTVKAKGKWMLIFFANTKYANKKLVSRRQVRKLINHKVLAITNANGRFYIVDNETQEIVGVAKRTIRQKKRISFFENFENNTEKQNDILGKELEKALTKIAEQT